MERSEFVSFMDIERAEQLVCLSDICILSMPSYLKSENCIVYLRNGINVTVKRETGNMLKNFIKPIRLADEESKVELA